MKTICSVALLLSALLSSAAFAASPNYRIVDPIKVPDAPYDPSSKLVFSMNHDSGEATVVDPMARKAVETIAIGGTFEFPAADGAGRGIARVPGTYEVLVIAP